MVAGQTISTHVSNPPGRIKIIRSLRELLEENNFNNITTAQIAKNAGVTEGLIYKYFKDKRDLLYHVLEEHFTRFLSQIKKDLNGIDDILLKIKVIIQSSLQSYANHRVFARIVILEVRNSEDYFKSGAYQLVKEYNQMILDIIKKGISKGIIRSDIDPSYIRHSILGSIEHACLKGAIFKQEVSSYAISENILKIIFNGISDKKYV